MMEALTETRKAETFIFPPLKENTNFKIWEDAVDSLKVLSEYWRKIPDDEKDEKEAHLLYIACMNNKKVAPHLHDLRARKKTEAFSFEIWRYESWQIIRKLCELSVKDERIEVEKRLREFPDTVKAYGRNINKILEQFKVLRADARPHSAFLTSAFLADQLLRAMPSDFSTTLALSLDGDQTEVDKVIDRVDKWVLCNGAELRAVEGTQQFVKKDSRGAGAALFTTSKQRPQTEGPVKKYPHHRGGKNNGRPSTCIRCGAQQRHPLEQCPARDSTCTKCNRVGHFTSECRTGGNKREPASFSGWLGEECEYSLADGNIISLAEDESEGVACAVRLQPRKCIYVDSCTSNHLFSEATIAQYIVSTHEHKAQRILADGQAAMQIHKRAVVNLPLLDVRGEQVVVNLEVDIGPDHCVPLLRPKHLHLVESPSESWATLVEKGGNVVQVAIDHPQGDASRSLPYLTLNGSGMGPGGQHEKMGHDLTCAALTLEEVKGLHAKFGDIDAKRLVKTMEEQGRVVKMADAQRAREECGHCDERNAVVPTLLAVMLPRGRRTSQLFGRAFGRAFGSIPISIPVDASVLPP
eukprot:GHVU01147465.1.p1 GENE.GHVU01147465.1~~GHVU01147465.1.p1  ORF type:complete len:581 (-),score=45.73 GHVU01147465.1:188-1930(-)